MSSRDRGPIQDPIEQVLHSCPRLEQQVAGVFGLVNRVAVPEPAALLLSQIQPEAQAGGVDPPVADLAQAPYSRITRPGICDPGQALRIRDLSKTVPLLGEPDALGLGGDRNVLVAVEDHLRAERRMPGHLDHQVPERRVHDVKAVVVDVLPLLLQVRDGPARRVVHLPDRGRRLGGQDQEHPGRHRVLLQVLLRDQVLALPGRAEDQRHLVRRRPGLDPAGEPARHPHQVRVVKLVIAAAQPPPPGPEPARIMTDREERVDHNPVHAVIRAGQQVPVPFGEVISHALTVKGTCTSSQDISHTAPEGATPSGRSPGRSVATLWGDDSDR